MELKERLSAKLGPLPVWGWGAIGGGVILGYMFLTRNNDAGEELEEYPETTLYPTISGEVGVSEEAAKEPSWINSNTVWGANGQLIGVGAGFGPGETAAAISAYLAGKSLTADQQAIINIIIAELGLPPNPLPVPVVTPTPSPGVTVPAPVIPVAPVKKIVDVIKGDQKVSTMPVENPPKNVEVTKPIKAAGTAAVVGKTVATKTAAKTATKSATKTTTNKSNPVTSTMKKVSDVTKAKLVEAKNAANSNLQAALYWATKK